MSLLIESKGGRAFGLRLDEFPVELHKELKEKMSGVTDKMEARARGLAPYKSGRLRSEIAGRTFADSQTRVASYVNVFAPDAPKGEYAKAATLEYGSDKPREINDKSMAAIDRITKKTVSKSVRIAAILYLRGALEDVQAEVIPEIQAAIDETVRKGNA